MKKISFCIPTYNRREFLSQLLESIYRDCPVNILNAIEVCISDNASNDGTKELVETWQDRGLMDIVYRCQSKNNGPDRNFLSAAELAQGEYIWFMGSDDQIYPDALRIILDKLNTESEIYILGRANYDYDLETLSSVQLFVDGDGSYDLSVKKEAISYLSACGGIGGLFSYLSSIIVKSSSWRRHLNGVEEFIGTGYSHAFVLCKLAFDGGVVEPIGQALVKNRGGNDSFLNKGLVNRILIDMEGYLKICNSLNAINADTQLRKEFCSVVARERPLFRALIYIRRKSNEAEWSRAYIALRGLGLFRVTVGILNYCPAIVKLLDLKPVLAVGKKFFL